jgi:hypothetical protein
MHQVHLRHTPAPIHPTYGYHYFTISLIDTITHLERIQNSDWKELRNNCGYYPQPQEVTSLDHFVCEEKIVSVNRLIICWKFCIFTHISLSVRSSKINSMISRLIVYVSLLLMV